MKNLIVSTALFFGMPAIVLADKIPVNEALNIARQFIMKSASTTNMKQACMKKTPVLVSQTEGHYVFNIGTDNGYIVVACDDMVKDAILGYADNGSFSEKNIPENLRWWLGEYDRQIDYMQQHKEEYMKNSASTYAEEDSPQQTYTEIAPLMTSKWNQDSPYNAKCTEKNGTVCPTGCVATAMAQIMYYNKWPETGTGTYKGMDYNSLYFDWNNMTDIYNSSSSELSKEAVSTLMYAIGKAVDMEYDPSGSGATSFKTLNGVKRNFGYTKAMSVIRNYMSPSSWDKYIYDELSHNRPVFYTGATAQNEGHAFVCDGFRDGFLHINWGWGGAADGYFRSNVLNPPMQGIGGSSGDGFNYYQEVITNMYNPNDDNQRYIFSKATSSISIDKQEADANETLTLSTNISTNTDESQYAYGVRVVDDNGNTVYIMEDDKRKGGDLLLDNGYTINLADFPKADGNYTVTPVVYGADSKTWTDIYSYSGRVSLPFAAIVKDNRISFSNSIPMNIEISNVEVPEETYANELMTIKAKIRCSSGTDFNEKLYIGFQTEGEPLLYQQENAATIVLAGMETETSFDVTAPKETGEYHVALFTLVDGEKTKLTDYHTVKVIEKMPILNVVNKITFSDKNYDSVDPNNIKVKAIIRCTMKDFNDELRFVVYDYDTNEQIGYIAQQGSIKDGYTKNITISGNLNGTIPGHFYHGNICYMNEEGNWVGIKSKYTGGTPANYIKFKTAEATSIQGIENDRTASLTETFTIDGRRIEKTDNLNRLGHSMYITKTGGKWVKVIR